MNGNYGFSESRLLTLNSKSFFWFIPSKLTMIFSFKVKILDYLNYMTSPTICIINYTKGTSLWHFPACIYFVISITAINLSCTPSPPHFHFHIPNHLLLNSWVYCSLWNLESFGYSVDHWWNLGKGINITRIKWKHN
jgi:hypothetical protein